MLSETNARTMLALQADMNAKVNPNWLDAGYPFLRAVVMEGAEAIEHTGRWKWWRSGTPNVEQLRLELVDIFHFTLSALLVSQQGCVNTAAKQLFELARSTNFSVPFDGTLYQIDALDTVEKLELLIGISVSRRINLVLFESIMLDVEMSWNDLYREYIGKNVLNHFRQDNGYKSGSYQKLWDGREDNDHLIEIVTALDANSIDFREQVYARLVARYAAVIGAA